MKPSTLTILLLTLSLTCFQQSSKAQNSDSTELANLSAELDALFANESDSLSLLSLLDSLLTIPQRTDQLSFRLGYSSRVTTAGRDFGVDQQGISPGISYYHKSGLYGDITGIWNSELDPKYYLTITTIGYLGTIGKKWSFNASYDHSFYHSSDTLDIYPLTNSLSTSISYDFKYAYSGLNYSFAFGDETANQLTWNLTGVIRKRLSNPSKSISFLPTFSVLWGNQTLTYSNIATTEDFIQNLSNEEIRAYFMNRDNLSNQDKFIRAGAIIELRNDLNDGTTLTRQQEFILSQFSNQLQTEVDSFGLLNYYLSFPVSFNTNKLSLLLSYNYNIPKELPESVLEETESNGYFSFTLSYNIGF